MLIVFFDIAKSNNSVLLSTVHVVKDFEFDDVPIAGDAAIKPFRRLKR